MYAAMTMGSISSSPEVIVLAPFEEALYRARVRRPGVTVADSRAKEFDEAAAGAFAVCCDRHRQHFEPGAHQRGRRYD